MKRSLTVEWQDPGTLAQPPICHLLGYRLAEVEPGRVVFEGTPGEQHYNPIGVVHGGLAMTLLDAGSARPKAGWKTPPASSTRTPRRPAWS
jgi:acyl-coenzyme A thioesterase PaaI-like protein